MDNNPINWKDLFNFDDQSEINQGIAGINDLDQAYKEFYKTVSKGQLKRLAEQEKDLAKVKRELIQATKDLSIANEDAQKKLLENLKVAEQTRVAEQTAKIAKEETARANNVVKDTTISMTAELRKLRAEYEKAFRAQDTAKMTAVATQARVLNTNIQQVTSALRAARPAFTAAAGSYNELDQRTKQLVIDLRAMGSGMAVNSVEARRLQGEIAGNTARLRDFDRALNQNFRNVGNYPTVVSQIGGQITSMLGPIALFTAALASIRSIVRSNSEISDSLSDVRRTAQLTEGEAGKLVDTLKQLDTRTSLKGLLDIAIIAGQLGIAKRDIAGFVEAIDELAVVLSNEIPGGAEEVATALGKINGVFKTQQIEGTNINEAYNKTGSAILALGQVGLATGAYLQDFALRTAGVAQTAKISLPTILAYSAVLEETGSSAEVAGTAFNRLVGSLASKREKFFAIAKLGDANLTLAQFSDIINTDANQALQLFFKGLNKSQNLTQFIDLLGEIKIKAGPAQNAIIALAQNQEKLNERIGQSQDAYNEGSLAVEQFELKNNNLAASLDKLGNKLTNISTNPDSNIGKLFKYIVDAAGDAADEVDKMIGRLSVAATLLNNIVGNNFSAKQVTGAVAVGRRASLIQANRDQAMGRGTTKANSIAGNAGDQAALKKSLASEEAKLQVLFKQANYAKAFVQDTKNSTEAIQPQIKKLKEGQALLLQQETTVKRLREIYKGLYGPVKTPGNPDTYKPEEKGKKGKSAEQMAKEAQRAADQIIQANAKLRINEAELEFAQSAQGVTDKEKFEAQKLEILTQSYEDRKKLYAKDTDDYKKLEAEQVDAKTNYINAVNKALDDEAKAEEKALADRLKRIEEFEKAKAKANKAQVALDLANAESSIKTGVANKDISPEQANDMLYNARKEVLEKEVADRKYALAQLSAEDAEYYDTKADLLQAEKDLIDERTDYEVAKAHEAAEKRKEIAQQIVDFSTELNEVAFGVLGVFNERRIAQLEQEKDFELGLAGENADAKKKIEERYQKEIAKEKRKAAIADKAAAIISIAINTAAAVLKVTAQTGILAPFVIPGIIALGVIQAGIVAAKPIPKFAVGTKNAPEGLAVVGERGTEAIEENGKVRFSGPRPELTYLQKGAKVLTAQETQDKYNYDALRDRAFSDSMLTSLLDGTGVVLQVNNAQQTEVLGKILQRTVTPEQMERAMSKAIEGLPIQQLIMDEKGNNTYIVKKNQRIRDQNARNTIKGQG